MQIFVRFVYFLYIFSVKYYAMEIFLFLLHKFFVFSFIFAVLYLVREGFRFISGIRTGVYQAKKYTVLWVGVCIAHIITTLITGFIV